MKIVRSYRLTPESYQWVTEKAKKDGISKNGVIQTLVNREMDKEKKRT